MYQKTKQTAQRRTGKYRRCKYPPLFLRPRKMKSRADAQTAPPPCPRLRAPSQPRDGQASTELHLHFPTPRANAAKTGRPRHRSKPARAATAAPSSQRISYWYSGPSAPNNVPPMLPHPGGGAESQHVRQRHHTHTQHPAPPRRTPAARPHSISMGARAWARLLSAALSIAGVQARGLDALVTSQPPFLFALAQEPKAGVIIAPSRF